MAVKPIKRDPKIVRLSREHHFGLLFGWKLRQGIKFGVQPERMKVYVQFFWEHRLQEHFKTEENVLFLNKGEPLVAKALAQHKAFENLVREICTTEQPTIDQMKVIADIISDHIRFEERELFPHLEKTLSEAQLMNVGRQLDDLHGEPAKDEFWIK